MKIMNKERIMSPIEFVKKYQENPLRYIEQDVNGKDSFAILKTTQGGKYIRGNLLFYSINGIEVYTDPDNIIFVDLLNNTLFIKEYSKIIDQMEEKDPEDKQYILLYTDLGYQESEEEFPLRWEAVKGRTTAYDSIKANAPVIDIDKSIVLVETVPIKDSLSVREFVNYVRNADMVDVEDGFNIDLYDSSEYI